MNTSAAVLDRMQMPSPHAQSRPLSLETVELGKINTGFDRLAAGEAVRQPITFQPSAAAFG